MQCLAFQSYTQTTGFAPDGAEWYYTLRIPFSSDIVFVRIYTAGDTLIDGKLCTILIKEDAPGCYGGVAVEYVYTEDSVVYFYDLNFNMFQVLYDYTKKVGEFWNIQLPYDTMQVYIDSVDYIEINDELLRIQFAKYQILSGTFTQVFFEDQIFERIGNTHYLFIYPHENYGACDMPYSKGLRCYSDPEFGLYETGTAISCDYTPLSETESNYDFTIYPNPVSNYLNLDVNTSDCLQIPKSVNMYNALGELILQITDVHCGLNTIPVNHLPAGIYFLSFLQNGQRMYSEKLVIE